MKTYGEGESYVLLTVKEYNKLLRGDDGDYVKVPVENWKRHVDNMMELRETCRKLKEVQDMFRRPHLIETADGQLVDIDSVRADQLSHIRQHLASEGAKILSSPVSQYSEAPKKSLISRIIDFIKNGWKLRK
ncbi:hypothetical protein DYU11_11615 [Fibrisoma montanum]|uniref:Uncharacterized protein n=1 Tax=Fibrisoma montanum TaxID=2305895 RepID=A0A418MB65_9BACT|nr:hypothetical protein [Fibrisoma montanum]RIV23622.1 hypothetical protein DYU11_11615 [Fibrisoma montanum]